MALLIDGIVNVNKSVGLTSHDVVARVRRITGQRKAGHAGTLDPMASGVLPVALGKATRLVEYLADADKAYAAVLMLGATTDTYDREGVVTPTPGAIMPTRETLEAAMAAYRGQIKQLPPMYSAIKMGGKKLYELAREGITVERKERPVTIYTLELQSYDPPLARIFVECSKGTYIRSLAFDLGASLGTGAYLDALTRTRHGPFSIEDAVTLEELEATLNGNDPLKRGIYPAEYIIRDWRTHTATPNEERDIIQGKLVELPPPTGAERPQLAAKTASGELLAVLYWDDSKGAWQPKKVFNIKS